jgi:5-methylcytosine-specific restriction endonuclease McrA
MVICMASKISKACDISSNVRQEVLKRDRFSCIVCGKKTHLQIAHYISRARLGLGIAENLAVMCAECHFQYDNGNFHEEIKNLFREHLTANYEEWNEQELTYKKWRF